jgi:hypothetical protein
VVGVGDVAELDVWRNVVVVGDEKKLLEGLETVPDTQ